MQRSHSPTTWRHPKENDTMGSTYSWGNLAPWQVCVVGVAIAETGHLTLWLAVSGCQVGVQKKERNNWIFFFSVPQVIIQASLSIFVPYSQNWLYTQVITVHYHGNKPKRDKSNRNGRTNNLQRSTWWISPAPLRRVEMLSGQRPSQVTKFSWCFYALCW